MSPIRNQIELVLDHLSEEQQQMVFELIRHLPSDIEQEDLLSAQDIRDVQTALDEFARGEVYTLDDVEWK